MEGDAFHGWAPALRTPHPMSTLGFYDDFAIRYLTLKTPCLSVLMFARTLIKSYLPYKQDADCWKEYIMQGLAPFTIKIT